MNLKNIQNILSLRYDPESKPFFPHKTIEDYSHTWEDSMPDGYEEYIRENLESQIIEQLSKYDKIAISLSGGVDSVLLLGMISMLQPEKKILAINDESSGETEQAMYVAKKFNVDFKSIRLNNMIEEIPFYVELTKEPRWNVYHHHIWKTAKNEGCDILVTGDGADELFGGYVFRYNKFMKDEFRTAFDYLSCHMNDMVEDQRDLFIECEEMWDNVYSTLDPYFKDGIIEEVLMADYNGKLLHDFLPTNDKIIRHYGTPTFSPYLELRDMASHIPTNKLFNIDYSVGKLPLRRIAVYYDVPISLNKVGYTRDIVNDYIQYGEPITNMLADKNSKIYEIINREWVLKNITNYEDKRVCNKLLQLYALEHYLREGYD